MGSEKVLENFSRGPGKSSKSPVFFPVKEWDFSPQQPCLATNKINKQGVVCVISVL